MNYDRIEEIGKGGFGIVYKVRGDDGKVYAQKEFIPAASPQADPAKLIERFKREVRYQQQIDHPNVVPVLDAELDASPPWFVMPLADGTLKDDLVKDNRLGGNPKKPLFDILAGLEELHRLGIYHRDLTPANVLKFMHEDGATRYAISDFGLIKPVAGQTTTLTDTNIGGGTEYYCAPECLANFRGAMVQADIYSFGAILHDIYHGLVKRTPYSELTVAGPLGPIVERCTKKQPLRRYASITALRKELSKVLDNTDVEYFSEEEEGVIAILESKDHLTDDEWDRVYALIDDNAEKDISNDNIMRVLSLNHIDSIHASSPDMFQALGGFYAEFAENGGFNFDYCDIISEKAEKFFNLSDDVGLKAKIALAMLELGTSHNRWMVERQFMRMVGHNCDPALAERIRIEVRANDIPFDRMVKHVCWSINISPNQLHPILHELLEQGDE